MICGFFVAATYSFAHHFTARVCGVIRGVSSTLQKTPQKLHNRLFINILQGMIYPMDRTSNGNFITSMWSKMEKSFGLMFYQKKTKQHVQGMKVPIYVRITVNNEQTDLSTKQKCNLGLWNAEIGRMNGKSEEARELNAFLDLIEQKVYASKRKLMEMDVEVTAERIRCLVQDRPIDQDRHTIMEAFKLHNEQMKQLVGIDFAEGTMERYQTSYDHTLRKYWMIRLVGI